MFEGNLQFFGYGILPIIEGSQDDRIEPIEDEPPDWTYFIQDEKVWTSEKGG